MARLRTSASTYSSSRPSWWPSSCARSVALESTYQLRRLSWPVAGCRAIATCSPLVTYVTVTRSVKAPVPAPDSVSRNLLSQDTEELGPRHVLDRGLLRLGDAGVAGDLGVDVEPALGADEVDVVGRGPADRPEPLPALLAIDVRDGRRGPRQRAERARHRAVPGGSLQREDLLRATRPARGEPVRGRGLMRGLGLGDGLLPSAIGPSSP